MISDADVHINPLIRRMGYSGLIMTKIWLRPVYFPEGLGSLNPGSSRTRHG